MVKQKASFLRAVEHDCGIHCSGRPLTLAFPAPTLQLRQITLLVPSTGMRLSDTLMELTWLLRKCTWMQAGTCQTPLLSCVHSRMLWLKVTEGQSHEPGWWPESWAFPVFWEVLLSGVGVMQLHAASLGISALCPFRVEWAAPGDEG